MAQPTPYSRRYNFTNYQTVNPAAPLPAAQLDLELSSVKLTLDQILANLRLIQRDDTAVANQSIGYDQLKAELNGFGFNPPATWVTAHQYIVRDTVFEGSAFYQCVNSHVSAVFATDLGAGDWLLIADFSIAYPPVEVQVDVATAVTTVADADLLPNVVTAGPTLEKITQLNHWTNYLKPKADALYATAAQGAVATAALSLATAALPAASVDTDGTLTANSDTRVASQKATKTFINAFEHPGFLFGLTLSNDVTTPNTVLDIAAGSATAVGTTSFMALAAAITKSIGAVWAVGTGNGGLDTGAVAVGTWYHVYLIERPDTGVVDVLFSLSATAPTMPTNYTLKRRIGSIKTDGSSHILAFEQFPGGVFKWVTPPTDRSSTSSAASALLALSIPLGLPTRPILNLRMNVNISSNVVNMLGDAVVGSANISVQQVIAGTGGTAGDGLIVDQFVSNLASQIYFAATISGGTISFNSITTMGWIDDLGRSA